MRVVPWEEIFKFGALAATTKFYGWVYIGIDVHILNRKYNDKSHLSPWFSVACASAIAHRNHSFPLIQQSNSSASEVNSNRLLVVAAIYLCLRGIKESITSQKRGSRDFW